MAAPTGVFKKKKKKKLIFDFFGNKKVMLIILFFSSFDTVIETFSCCPQYIEAAMRRN